MKRNWMKKISLAAVLVLVIAMLPVFRLDGQAGEVIATVYGTVLSGTTAEILKLSTKDGNMEIKLDSGTDTSTCKILLPNKKISVSLSHESDGYLHAVKIANDIQTNTATVDPATTVTVSGTLNDKTRDDILYLNTAQGEMQIRLDTTTNMSNCAVLVAGKTYSISCARGSDAYMHAVSISDPSALPPAGGNTNGGNNNGGNAGTGNGGNVSTMSITGTVSKNTKENILFLDTKDGEMQFVIDSNADTSRGLIHTPGNKLTVAFYHGSDAYLHTTSTAGSKDGDSGAQLDANIVTVTGTVAEKSNQNILYLDTSGGQMEVKLDKISGANNCKVLVSGRKVSVSMARGSDAYMHATAITGIQ